MTDETQYYVPEYEALEDRKYAEKILEKCTLEGLVKRFSESVDKETGDIKRMKDYWDGQKALRNELGVPSRENVNKAIGAILDRIERLEARLRNHRHDFSKTFTGKAEY